MENKNQTNNSALRITHSEFRIPNSELHLRMQTANKADENFKKLAEMFPNAVTEAIDETTGEVIRAIDKDVLMQEINTKVVDGKEERYQFTWPDKKKSVLLANAPINKTLRPCREESVDFDNTENLYIEGDNLEVLKLLQETYLGKIKMIYIDPPYNTGNDFVYNDDFSMSNSEFVMRNSEFDENGNRLVKNLDTNGRFHTDWLNMIYPRLKLAKDLLSDDGVIFVSVDYNENFNMRKILDEIFGNSSFTGEIYWESKTKSQNTVTSYNKLQPKAEMIFVYSKQEKRRFNLIKKGEKSYPLSDERGKYREHCLEVMNANGIRGRETMVFDISDGVSTVSLQEGKQWKLGQDQVATYKDAGDLFIRDEKVIIKMRPEYERTDTTEPFWGFFSKDLGTAESAKKELKDLLDSNGFETVKPLEILKRLIYHATNSNDIILDFFSGSATTAHAVMQLNAEDGGNRKFIMVQLPEETDEKSEAYKAGYKNICEIGKERIRRAGQKINSELAMRNAELNKNTDNNSELRIPHSELDTGFRVLKCDTSNMKDVYYNPHDLDLSMFDDMVDNIKEDRTAEDLLFQVMLDLGILLSSKIQCEELRVECEDEIHSAHSKLHTVYNVADGFLIACFDENITTELITEIAKKQPYYFVMRDNGFADDSVATNFDQIFAAYSPDTVRKVL